jgi:EAL and modified HD-GYP domain-containing signal transduction protein
MSSSESLNRFLARQPILTVDKKSYAYEILSRYGPENYCRPSTDKTINVNAVDELFLRGIATMTEGLPAFINCTSNFLVNEYLTLLPREQVVAEIPETVMPDPAVIRACRQLKSQGYVFALDDHCDSEETQPFLDFADFVKIDVLTTSFEEQKRIVAVCHPRGIPAIAEKVETDQQFQICKSLGYAFFQGYFFCRPQMVARRSVAANKMVYLELLRAANEIEFNLQKIASIFKRDVSLSYRLLRFLNSPLFGLQTEVRSIRHALSLMGERAMRKWISLVSIASLGDEAADGLLKLPLLRAMFCELLGKRPACVERRMSCF